MELVEVEKQFAVYQNIPPPIKRDYNKVKKDDFNKAEISSLKSAFLTQWRILFCIKNI